MEEVVDVVRTNDATDAAQNKALGIIAYLGILCIVTIIAAKESRFAKFHANQGLLLFLLSLAVYAVGYMPMIGWMIRWPGHIVVFVFMILGIVNAANGEMKPLPLIGTIKLLN